MKSTKTLYVVVFGEYGEGQSPISINLDLEEAKRDVEFRRSGSGSRDLTYIEVWEPSKPKVGKAVPGRYDMVRTIPTDPHDADLDQCRGQR